MRPTVDIVIPVLNEEATIELNVGIILEFLEKELAGRYDYTLIVADNGSTDDTAVITGKLISQHSDKLRYLKVDRRGVGLALKTAWIDSKAEFVGYMDLDMATDLCHIPAALALFSTNNSDVIYGTRLHKDSTVIGRTIKREITSRIFNYIVQVYLGTKFSDGMCGFKFLRKEHLNSIIKNGAQSDGWFFCTELLVVSEWFGLRVDELPVKWTDDPNSKVNIKKLALEYISAMKELKRVKQR
ncbi:glycosyltransferase [Vibrio sp. 03-59-1]|uniref:glycosyltransferase n=1 Tax=Vibrio sp. 03-59-1 TaxID=2607607 RepID=UPI0014937743|nr:glycosyltransferase [Vibrio sp. 03-59-1]NOH84523.1 glycosyltransferase [Vibrio sp. 03-59-1]